MTATTHQAITVLTARLVIGALVLAAMILIGIGITQADWQMGLVNARP